MIKTYNNISAQKVSWVKSNKENLEKQGNQIENLYYPENLDELKELIEKIKALDESFELIGYSSNTLFLPSYKVKHLICTKFINKWTETDKLIVCECGVNVSLLSKEMIKKGFVGFEGLTDLPGTVAAAVYGNCGCRNCSINDLLDSFTLLLPNGEIRICYVEDLGRQYRSTTLKRKELSGVILQVSLRKQQGNPKVLLEIADKNHTHRMKYQPNAANNLGTTFIGQQLTFYGMVCKGIEKLLGIFYRTRDSRIIFAKLLKILGKEYFVPYVYYWNRFMFLDENAHLLFPKYILFLKGLYNDLHLEIEIRK